MKQISLLVRIKTEPSTIYNLLTSTQGIGEWFTKAESSKYVEGGKLTLVFPNEEIEFSIKTMQKDTRVIWHCTSPDNPWYATDIIFELKPSVDSTTVIFDHSGWPEITDLFRDCSMSWAYFLESLRTLIEEGKGTPEGVTPSCEFNAT